MTEPCEHKHIELLYTTFVADGIDTVCKCKDCGETFVAKGCIITKVESSNDSNGVVETVPFSMGCVCKPTECSICEEEYTPEGYPKNSKPLIDAAKKMLERDKDLAEAAEKFLNGDKEDD